MVISSSKNLSESHNTSFDWGTRTYVMGIINVTPDSFSGDGLSNNKYAAVEQGIAFESQGADILDVGGQSTRPGHTPITQEEELQRVIPVIKELASRVKIPISIDTFFSRVADEAVAMGASIINDQWALNGDAEMASLASRLGVPIVLMHNQTNTEYQDLISDIRNNLEQCVRKAKSHGIPMEHIIVDPGLGFGKTTQHNLTVVQQLSELKGIASAILVGPSRKSMIGRILDLPIDERIEGTAAIVALCIANGADIVRVHDVRAMVRVCRMTDAVVRDKIINSCEEHP